MAYELNLLKKLTVLFAEDEVVTSNQVKGILQIFFHDVFVAYNGKEAFELYEMYTPDIVITDVRMPYMDGIKLTKKIRDTKSNIPIILLSSLSDQKTLLSAANSGIDGYILKPIELESLLRVLEDVLKRKHHDKKYLQLSQNLIYHFLTEELYKNGQLIELGKKEKQLLKLFIQNSEKTLTKERIMSTVWELETITESALKNLLNRLRAKLDEDLIVSVKGSGWKLNIAQ